VEEILVIVKIEAVARMIDEMVTTTVSEVGPTTARVQAEAGAAEAEVAEAAAEAAVAEVVQAVEAVMAVLVAEDVAAVESQLSIVITDLQKGQVVAVVVAEITSVHLVMITIEIDYLLSSCTV
jgi:hypothetical protein